jgi:hypothetical protein
MKWQADWLLAKGGERKAKVLTVLTASLLGYYSYFGIYTYSYFKRGRTTKSQKLIFSEDYSTLMSK